LIEVRIFIKTARARQQNVIRHKIGLLNLAAELGNVSKTCKVMGLSRDTFYRDQNAVAEGGVEALFYRNRRKPNPKNRVAEATETAVLAYAIEQPAHGQVRVSNELCQRGIFVSPSGVRSIWLRNDLASFKQRLAALEKQAAEQGILLTDAQVAALATLARYRHSEQGHNRPGSEWRNITLLIP